MAKTLLEQLKEVTVVVADSGDFESIEQFKPQDTTTNPSLLTAAAGMPQYQPIVDGVLLEAKKQLGPQAKDKEVANLAFRHLAVAFGKKILAIVPGRVSTEVDARLSFDTAATMKQAREIIQQYDEAGISRERVSDQDRLHLAGYQGRGATGEGRHPLQLDAAVWHASSDRMRRG